jgi:chemotaxis protein CheD
MMGAAEALAKASTVVGVADCGVGKDGQGRLVTYALGSCIGITAYDPVTRIGGLLHYMLPQPAEGATGDPGKPCIYASTGVPILFDMLKKAGAMQNRLVVCAAGGAEILENGAAMAIGRKNHAILRKALWKIGVALTAEETGGNTPRTLSLDLQSGTVVVRTKDGDKTLWAPGANLAPKKATP